MIYHGIFESKEDIEREFSTKFDGMVLYASYEQGDYDGHANVVYFHKGKLYYVEGYHCSCHGLEECWNPEETTIDVLAHMITKSKGSMSNERAEFMLDTIKPALDRQDFDEVMMLLGLLS